MTLLDKWRKGREERSGRKKKPEESPDREQLPLSEFPAEKGEFPAEKEPRKAPHKEQLSLSDFSAEDNPTRD